MEIGSIPNLMRESEELNAPNPFKQLQEEWAEELSDKFIEDEERKQAKKSKLSPGTLKKLREYRRL